MSKLIPEVGHSVMGPSSFDRVSACPSSAILSMGLEPVPASTYAAEGTVAHSVFAACLRDGYTPEDFLGTSYEVGAHEIAVDQEMVHGVRYALDTVAEYALPGEPIEVEVRLQLGEGSLVWGYSDYLLAKRRPVFVADLKYGIGIEVPPDTRQVGLYGLMAAIREYGEIWVLGGGPDSEVIVESLIIQPRALGLRLKPHDWTRGDLRELYQVAQNLSNDVQMRRHRYQAGSHCRFCAATPVCPKLAAIAQDAVMAEIANDPEYMIRAEELDARLSMLPALKLYIARIEQLGQEYLESGGSLTSVKVVEMRARRQWFDETDAARWLRSIGVEPFKQALLSPAQAEAAMAKEYRKDLKDYTVKNSSGLTLAPADDSRPAVAHLSERAAALRMQTLALLARQSGRKHTQSESKERTSK